MMERPWRRRLACYGGLALLSASLLALLVPFGEWPLRVPFDYMGDGLTHTALIKGIAEEGPVRLTRIGAPFGADIADWPQGMWLQFGVTSLLYYATGHAGTAINLYWLLSIVATGLTAQWSLRRLGVPPGESFVTALLYSFLPYVFYRNVGHFPIMYPFVPLVGLLCLRVAGLGPGEADRRERWVTLGACFAQGWRMSTTRSSPARSWWSPPPSGGGELAGRTRSSSRGAASSSRHWHRHPLVPSVAYWSRHGRNPVLAYKTVADADVFGLKIRHLLTPIDEHPIGLFRAAAARVTQASFPIENENATARLGLVGSVGFLFLLATALGAVAGARPVDDRLGPPAALTLTALLLGLVGGFGSIFNLLVTPDIRGYNRVVVFIAFFSLYAGSRLLARVTASLPHAGRSMVLRAAVLVAVAAFGVLDQVPVETLALIRARGADQFAEDESFVALVESRLPVGAMVFQLPHGSIPLDLTARPPRFVYDGARAYLNSAALRWSWGSINGRTGEWQLSVSKLSPSAMARRLALAGFEGIWIDRWGYLSADGIGAEQLERALADAARSPLWTSAKGRYSFIVLGDLRRRLEAVLGRERYRAAQEAALGQVDRLPARWREGCFDERADALEPSRWCGPRAWAVLKNEGVEDCRALLRARFRTVGRGRVTVAGPGFRDELDVTDSAAPYEREILVPGARRLRLDLTFDGPCTEVGGERHCVEVIDLQTADLERESERTP
jgi:phosphoglycerol transferase